MKIQFLGAAQTVTGSKYLLTSNKQKILVDCGLFQGLKNLRLKNWEDLQINPVEIDAVLLTHAHIDHSGWIPRLVKSGFRGKIYCTPATKELCQILLKDSGHLMEEEAKFLNRHKKTKHEPALPLFTVKDAENSIQYFETIEFNKRHSLGSDLHFEFRYVGHILGAASLIIEMDHKKIAFTGDIGRPQDPIFYPPEVLPSIDYLVTESTYGNRLHQNVDTLSELAFVINETVKQKGVILIPTFAVGRAQALMYFLSVLKKQKRIPDFPMYLNSPMAMHVGKIFQSFSNLHKLSEQECDETFNVVKYINSVEESKSLNEQSGPLLIIAASGMLTGGRILHHIKAFGPSSKNVILLTGFQGAGTRGEALLNNADELKIHGEYVPIRAQVKTLSAISAHSDYKEIIQWFATSKISPRRVFITHGEASAADELRRRLTEAFAWDCVVPMEDEIISLD